MAAIINFISTMMLTAALAFGSLGQPELVNAKRVDIQDWSTGGEVPAQVVCAKEGGDTWSVFLAVTQELGPKDLTVKGSVKDIEMTMTVTFTADSEAIMNMITQARQQGATVEIS